MDGEIRLCNACTLSPRGIDGHEALHALQELGVSSRPHVYRCAACASDWARVYLGEGQFTWIRDVYPQPEKATGSE
ncbi:MAG TPA: hypothetical protein VFV90_04985 [Usitatibacter sp.]|nr:hypothetical protein [Usitatibacter sp.]